MLSQNLKVNYSPVVTLPVVAEAKDFHFLPELDSTRTGDGLCFGIVNEESFFACSSFEVTSGGFAYK